MIGGAAVLGYFLGGKKGAAILVGLSFLAALICLGGALSGWAGLLLSMLLVAGLGAVLGHQLSGRRGAVTVALLWAGWCLLGLMGYQATYGATYQIAHQAAYLTIYKVAYRNAYLSAYAQAYRIVYQDAGRVAAEAAGREAGKREGRLAGEGAVLAASQATGQRAGPVGFVLISLPAVALFWAGAYVLSQQLLPLGDKVVRARRRQALRALLTYTLGTNLSYYVVENRKATTRVAGDRFRKFFAGPGIVLTGCDHTAVISDGIKIKEVVDPGLTFIQPPDVIAEVIDLRFQNRSLEVEALTKDGIRVKAPVSVSFRINAGDDWPRSDASFPFRKSAVFEAVRAQPIEHSRSQSDGKVIETKQKRTWDQIVGIVAARAIRRVIGNYTFDELYALYDLQKNPRPEIVQELRQQLRGELGALGIQVVGGGVGNLQPVDDTLVQQRIDNWQAELARQVTVELGKGEAEYIRMIESARALAQAEMIRTISEGFEHAGSVDATIATEVIALRFVETLDEMIQSPAVQKALPPSSAETLEAIKRSMGAYEARDE